MVVDDDRDLYSTFSSRVLSSTANESNCHVESSATSCAPPGLLPFVRRYKLRVPFRSDIFSSAAASGHSPAHPVVVEVTVCCTVCYKGFKSRNCNFQALLILLSDCL